MVKKYKIKSKKSNSKNIKINLKEWKKEYTKLSKLYNKNLDENIGDKLDNMTESITIKLLPENIYKKFKKSSPLMKYWYVAGSNRTDETWTGPKGTLDEFKKLLNKYL